MSFTIEWDYPARALFEDVPWPTSETVDAAVLRFARDHAPSLPSGPYRFCSAGYAIAVRSDRSAGTVLVLYVHRLR
ncbi:MAG: hypothetical protein U0359_07995 [Byssovorax sp.]